MISCTLRQMHFFFLNTEKSPNHQRPMTFLIPMIGNYGGRWQILFWNFELRSNNIQHVLSESHGSWIPDLLVRSQRRNFAWCSDRVGWAVGPGRDGWGTRALDTWFVGPLDTSEARVTMVLTTSPRRCRLWGTCKDRVSEQGKMGYSEYISVSLIPNVRLVTS